MTQTAHRYSTAAFFGNPQRTAAAISPDGRLIGYLADEGSRLNVFVEPVEGGDARCVTHDHHRNVAGFSWTGDPRRMLYLQDDDGDENLHVFRVDLQDPLAPAVDLTPFPGVRVEFELLAADPSLALCTMNLRRADVLDVYRLNLVTGGLELIVENPGTVKDWVLGTSGAIFAWTHSGPVTETLSRWSDGGLVPLFSVDVAEQPLRTMPTRVTPDGSGLWVATSSHTEHTQVVLVDATDGRQTVLASRDDLSVDETGFLSGGPSPLICDPVTGDLMAVRFLGERQVIEVVDPKIKPLLDAVSTLHDGDLGRLVGDATGRRWIVTFIHDRDPEATYLYDHETGESRLLFRPYPQLDPDELAPVQPLTVTSRDGLPLHCLLTLPKGVEPTALPLVLFVHGGPWFRDRWGWNARVQALANNGYAVLQVNMRGSTGFGRSFVRAGVGEFAGRMHDDLVDGVDWAVAEGIADPARVVIFGGSYGGYSALVGVTFTPEVFAGAIDLCGISRLADFMLALPIHLRGWLAWEVFIGNPGDPGQLAAMTARSPMSRVDAVTHPVLLVHGSKDTRVRREESDVIVESLRARGADVEYLVKPDEGHRFSNAENNIEVFDAVLAFLDRTIGA